MLTFIILFGRTNSFVIKLIMHFCAYNDASVFVKFYNVAYTVLTMICTKNADQLICVVIIFVISSMNIT